MTTSRLGGDAVPPPPADDESDQFYDSLDRILSSCSTSASASDDESEAPHGHRRSPPCRVPSAYDIWRTQPSPVQERRRRLLLQLGLSPDSSLSSFKPLKNSDLAVEKSHLSVGRSNASVERSDLYAVCPRSEPRPTPMPLPLPVNIDDLSQNKPPLAISASLGTSNSNTNENRDEDSDSAGDRDREKDFTIRNLDNGEEFVVREVEEDGAKKKMKVVTNGRQISMEEFQNSVVCQSPIVQELLRRQNEESSGKKKDGSCAENGMGMKAKKKGGGWFRNIKNAASNVVHRKERRSSDERDTSSEKGGRRSSSATDDSQDVHSTHGRERVRVKHYGKTWKELTGLYMNQEIHAHNGSIWTIKFSSDGQYLASAGEDCVIHVWKVGFESKGDFMVERGLGTAEDLSNSESSESIILLANLEKNNSERRRRAKASGGRKSFSFENVLVPEHAFALSDKPFRSFQGHLKDVLDLSWSKSEHLLSSSMDKTVKLWNLSNNTCLKTFSHNDYVTCIQFNPVDDNYFISGSLDAKVRLWNIKERQVADWDDLHEMVTATCYTPDSQAALVGTHKGSCHFYRISDNKLQQTNQINLQNKRKKSKLKKITGFQYAPESTSEVFVTSADSRIRVIDDLELVQKFKGFRNKTSQISASLTADGKHVLCASEDSHVYVWRYESNSRPGRGLDEVTVTQSYEHFHCREVSVAVAWPGTTMGGMSRTNSNGQSTGNSLSHSSLEAPLEVTNGQREPLSPLKPVLSNSDSSHLSDRALASQPEENLAETPRGQKPQIIAESNSEFQSRSAWGIVIVTAGRGGEIKVFQNFGYPTRV